MGSAHAGAVRRRRQLVGVVPRLDPAKRSRFLEDPNGKPVPYGSQEITQQSKNEIGMAYLFSLKEPPRNWKFVYKTPGVIVTTSLPYEIKGIKLP